MKRVRDTGVCKEARVTPSEKKSPFGPYRKPETPTRKRTFEWWRTADVAKSGGNQDTHGDHL
ncbi:hypothetical protein [Ensifer sp. LCM 4579]|uniref:hypothetical protein n=1 Tax=Ensifer sp. LCM 4579 TaxID=1848292 RepID=UPI000919CBB2|nr:hypothetical protein [Ensifer sp. LCM 4579]OHV75415.1 hypothetical protein LCM4579_07795 [Ensifer sp. LCM 4579]